MSRAARHSRRPQLRLERPQRRFSNPNQWEGQRWSPWEVVKWQIKRTGLDEKTYHVSHFGGTASKEENDVFAATLGEVIFRCADGSALAGFELKWSGSGEADKERKEDGGLHVE